MTKTPVQEKLEAQRKKDIREIVIESLEYCQRTKQRPVTAAAEMGISKATFYQWCREMEINPQDYRTPATTGEAS